MQKRKVWKQILQCLDLEKITLSPRRKLGIQNRWRQIKCEVFTIGMLEILRLERSMCILEGNFMKFAFELKKEWWN